MCIMYIQKCIDIVYFHCVHAQCTVLYVIYWRDVKLSAVVLGVILMTLLTLSLNTFIHTLVLIQLSFLVVTLTYIVTKIAIDSFYNRDVANPFRFVQLQN